MGKSSRVLSKDDIHRYALATQMDNRPVSAEYVIGVRCEGGLSILESPRLCSPRLYIRLGYVRLGYVRLSNTEKIGKRTSILKILRKLSIGNIVLTR